MKTGFRSMRAPRHWYRPVAAVALAAALALGAVGCGGSSTTVTVTHGPAPAPVYVDGGVTGASVGDVRYFHFNGRSGDAAVVMDWVMTTTATDSPEPGVEVRVTNAVFSFGGTDDTILLEGAGLYPGQGSILKVSAVLTRAIIGGTGRFEGARGQVVSTHNPDDSWSHVFRLA